MRLAAGELLVALLELAQALVEAVFLLGEAALEGLELAARALREAFSNSVRAWSSFSLAASSPSLSLASLSRRASSTHAGGFALGLGEALLADVADPRPAEDQHGGRDDDRGDRDP